MSNLLKFSVLSFLLVSGSAIADINHVKEAINVSGHTRAYSQSLAVGYLNKCVFNKSGDRLAQVVSTMDRTWSDLAKYEPVAKDKSLLQATQSMESEWKEYKALLTSECSKDNAKRVYGASDKFGTDADNYVNLLQKNIGKSAGAKLVNQAGRQRFLIMAVYKYNEMSKAGVVSEAESSQKIDAYKNKWLQAQKELRTQAAGKPEIEELLDTATSQFKTVIQNLQRRDATLDSMFDSVYDTVNQQVKMFESIE